MFTIIICKFISWLMRCTGRGATTMPGRIALRLSPMILKRLSSGVKVIIITGTNGKTTSARIIEEGLRRAGKSYFINRSGANLITGITSTFIANCNISGKCNKEYAVIECDENAFVKVSQYINANTVLVTNVFRDQLDRYGEINHTLDVIRKSVDNLPNAKLVINTDCSITNTLYRDNTVTYGVSVPMNFSAVSRDGTHCIKCGAKLIYEYHTYAHLGKYKCPSCGFARKEPDYNVTEIFETTENSSTVLINGSILTKIALGGTYNIYNAVGSYAALITAGIDPEHAHEALEEFSGAFGRMERFGNIRMILVKNPAGLDSACHYIDSISGGNKTVIFSLNDNGADGRDISWIWDADIKINGRVYTYGRRSADMALRLKYAGIKSNQCNDIIELVKSISDDVFIVPTYTSMMSMRHDFVREFGGKEFWQ